MAIFLKSAQSGFRQFAIFLYYLPSNVRNKILFKILGIQYGHGIQTKGAIYAKNNGTLRLGNNIRINSSPFANPIGGNERTYFQVMKGAMLTIGENTGLSNTAITSAKSITIGRNVRIGSGCSIFDTDFHPLNPKRRTHESPMDAEDISVAPIHVGDYAFIGSRSIILKGSIIGENSIIGAGSVVSGIIPTNEIWAGNPARFVRKLDSDELP